MTTAVDTSSEVQARQEKRGRLHALLTQTRENCPPLSSAPEPKPESEQEPEYEWEFDFAFDDWYDPRLSWCRQYANV